MIEISIRKENDLKSIFLQQIKILPGEPFRIKLSCIDTGWIILLRVASSSQESKIVVNLKETISVLVNFKYLDILQTLVKVDNNFLIGDNPSLLFQKELVEIYCLIGDPLVNQNSPKVKHYKFDHHEGFLIVFSDQIKIPL